MAEITGNSLIQDWYDRYVKPLKSPISLSSSAPQDFNVGLPPSSMPSSPPPQTPVNPPMEAPSAAPTPTTPTEGGSSWSDNLNKGMQDPAKVGVLGMGLSMMATPPRNVPYSAGEIVGNAGLHGLKFYQQAVDDKRRSEAMTIQQEDRALSREDQKLYRQGLLEDRATQREIQRQNAASLEEIRKASGAAKTGKLVPVRQADGSVAYERMLDAVGQEVPQKPERLVPVKQADGSVTYEKTSEAPGQAVPQKAQQKYKNVPGVGMVDISGDKPFVAIKAPVMGGKGGRGGAGGKPTANIQNIEYLVGNGWSRKEAEDVVLHGKRMPRENFIANMTKSVYGNEFIADEDKPKKMEEAIKFYDSTIPQRGGGAKAPAAAAGKALDATTAQSYLQKAGGDKNKAREMARKDGYTF